MTIPRIDINDVSVTYAATDEPVLEHLNFTPQPGKITLLCGSSGSGKSSILRLINGLIPHFHSVDCTGKVAVGEQLIKDMQLHEIGQLCATVFQNPRTQFFTAEVDAELAFAGQNFQVPAAEIIRRSTEALQDVGIAELAGRSLQTLSGGQLQKVACAQALAQATPIILFDEPTSNLDPEAIEDFTQILAKLKALGKTIIIAEHRLYFLRDLVDEVVLIDAGQVQATFTGTEFFTLAPEKAQKLGLRTLTKPQLTVDIDTPDPAPGGVHIEQLRVAFGKHQILDLHDVYFPQGKVTGIIGHNGVGKTTLARSLCGLQKIQPGSKVTGDVRLPSKSKAQAFLVMQDVHRQLFAESVEAEADAKYLAELELSALAQRHPLSLSGGQKQRLVCATALSMDIPVLLFDEPTSGVDFRHLCLVARMLQDLAANGKTVIVISHDVEFLNHCADHIVRIGPV